jgi:hypothetical protein
VPDVWRGRSADKKQGSLRVLLLILIQQGLTEKVYPSLMSTKHQMEAMHDYYKDMIDGWCST